MGHSCPSANLLTPTKLWSRQPSQTSRPTRWTSAAPRSALARRPLTSLVRPPSLTKHPIKLESTSGPIDAPLSLSHISYSGFTPTSLAPSLPSTAAPTLASNMLGTRLHASLLQATSNQQTIHQRGATGGLTLLGHVDADRSSDAQLCLQCLGVRCLG